MIFQNFNLFPHMTIGKVLKVLEQRAKEGITLVLVPHEMNFARDVGSRVVFMHQGKIWEQGDPKTILPNPQTDELKRFVGAVLQFSTS
jgi:polar amino acid transport system ATP-binding protein